MTNKEIRENAQKLRDLIAELGPNVTYESACAEAALKGLSLSKGQFKARQTDLGWIGPNSPEGQRRATAQADLQRKADKLLERVKQSQEAVWNLAMGLRDSFTNNMDTLASAEAFCQAVDGLRNLHKEIHEMEQIESLSGEQFIMWGHFDDPWTAMNPWPDLGPKSKGRPNQ